MSFLPLTPQILLYPSVRSLIQKELNRYPIKYYLTFYIPGLELKRIYSDLKISQKRMIASQKEFIEKRYDSLVKELTREAIDGYLKVENLHTGRKESLLTSGWALDTYLSLGKDKVKGVFDKKVIRWYLQLLLESFSVEKIIKNLVAWKIKHINIERKEMNSIIWENKEAIPIAHRGRKKSFKVSPLFGKSARECCYELNMLLLEWLLGKCKDRNYPKPKQLITIEKFHKVNFRFPDYHFTYLYPEAINLDINPDKLGRFLKEIKFPYLFILSGIRLDGKNLCLLDDFKLHEYRFFIEIYFKTKSNYRKWKKILNQGFTRARGSHLMERSIKRKMVPCYYFDIVPPTKEFVSHFISRKTRPVELPEGIWMPKRERPLTHKEIKKWLKNNAD